MNQMRNEYFESLLDECEHPDGSLIRADEYIERHASDLATKKRSLYQEWVNTVYTPIKSQLRAFRDSYSASRSTPCLWSPCKWGPTNRLQSQSEREERLLRDLDTILKIPTSSRPLPGLPPRITPSTDRGKRRPDARPIAAADLDFPNGKRVGVKPPDNTLFY
jgi:hypothetical protein